MSLDPKVTAFHKPTGLISLPVELMAACFSLLDNKNLTDVACVSFLFQGIAHRVCRTRHLNTHHISPWRGVEPVSWTAHANKIDLLMELMQGLGDFHPTASNFSSFWQMGYPNEECGHYPPEAGSLKAQLTEAVMEERPLPEAHRLTLFSPLQGVSLGFHLGCSVIWLEQKKTEAAFKNLSHFFSTTHSGKVAPLLNPFFSQRLMDILSQTGATLDQWKNLGSILRKIEDFEPAAFSVYRTALEMISVDQIESRADIAFSLVGLLGKCIQDPVFFKKNAGVARQSLTILRQFIESKPRISERFWHIFPDVIRLVRRYEVEADYSFWIEYAHDGIKNTHVQRFQRDPFSF